MKTVLCFLTIIHIIVLTSCGVNQPNNDQKKAVKANPTSNQEVQKLTKPKVRRPNPDNVTPFFIEYAEEHSSNLVRLKTRLGDIDIQLYDETPIHRANFLYNIHQDLYYKTIFYRVVPDFMIQGGNSDNDKTLEKREKEGAYYIPNECKPHLIHKRGAVAMAMSYDDNPENKSAQYSYYIVIGTPLTEGGLDAVEEEYNIEISDQNRSIYSTVGGTPHLDGVHTVFGEVVKGMDVVIAISKENKDSGDWPVNDVVIDCETLN